MNYKKENEFLKKEIEGLKKRIHQWENTRENSKKRRKLLLEFGSKFFAGQNLKRSILSSLEEIDKHKSIRKETLADLFANLIIRITRVGIFALIIGVFPILILLLQTYFLDIQNDKLDIQNVHIRNQTELVKNQNDLINQQVQLSEAARRSAQVFILGDILSDMNEELEGKTLEKRVLSPTLVGRIISLSLVARPYKYIHNNKLLDRSLSPERGQLLLSLVHSNLDTTFLEEEIFKRADFRNSDLIQVNLSNAHLASIDLQGSDLNNSTINDSNFRYANLNDVKLYGSLINSSIFTSAMLQHCDCRGIRGFSSDYSNATFFKANLKDATFNHPILNNNSFGSSALDNTVFYFSKLSETSNSIYNLKDWKTIVRDSAGFKDLDIVFKNYSIDSFDNGNFAFGIRFEKSLN